ncbi:MAG: YraN family protein [Lachnospiraceae bacterium]|nr:YraN family protein [Lachnospiraceae bacterium]
MNKRKVGSAYEEKAVLFLKKQGLVILCRNFRNRYGEIDIVARDNKTTVFVEVKYRRDAKKGLPEEAVDYRKRRRICRVADYYRMIHGMGEFSPVRFDVVAFCGEEIRWFRNAFDYIG